MEHVPGRGELRDGGVLLHLAVWHHAAGMPASLSWLWAEGEIIDPADVATRYPAGSAGDARVAAICAYFDAVGVLYLHDLLDDTLLFDWLTAARAWDYSRGYVLEQRRRANDPYLWSGFEALAVAQKRRTGEYVT